MSLVRIAAFGLLLGWIGSGCQSPDPDCCPIHVDSANFCAQWYQTGQRSPVGYCITGNVWGEPRSGYTIAYAADGCPYWTGPGDPSTGICPSPFADASDDLGVGPDCDAHTATDGSTDASPELDSESLDAQLLDTDDVADTAADGSASGADATAADAAADADDADIETAADGSASGGEASSDGGADDGSGADAIELDAP